MQERQSFNGFFLLRLPGGGGDGTQSGVASLEATDNKEEQCAVGKGTPGTRPAFSHAKRAEASLCGAEGSALTAPRAAAAGGLPESEGGEEQRGGRECSVPSTPSSVTLERKEQATMPQRGPSSAGSLGGSAFFPEGSIRSFSLPGSRGVRPGGVGFASAVTSGSPPVRPPSVCEQRKSTDSLADLADGGEWQGWCLAFAPHVYPEKADDFERDVKEPTRGASASRRLVCRRCVVAWWPASEGRGGRAEELPGEGASRGPVCEEKQTANNATGQPKHQTDSNTDKKKNQTPHQDSYQNGTVCSCLLPLAIASHVASAMRRFIKERIGLTTTAGNKVPFNERAVSHGERAGYRFKCRCV